MAISGDFTYLPDGTVRLAMSDGGVTVLSGAGEDAVVLSQTTADGTVFTEFDGAGNPGHVVFSDGLSGDYSYQPDGTVRLAMSDASVTVLSGTGEDAVVLTQTTAEGDVYSNFDALGRPTHVEFVDA